MDSIPLTERTFEQNGASGEEAIAHNFSQHSLATSDTNSTYAQNNLTGRKKARTTAVNSTYIKNYRFSRYNAALSSTMPFRRIDIKREDLPVDQIGCCSNMSFLWTRKYIVSREEYIKQEHSPANQALPKLTHADSCRVNSKRLMGIYKYEEQSHGKSKSSMIRVAWRFARTRILMAQLFQIIAHLYGIIGPAVFLSLILISMKGELDLKESLSTNSTLSDDDDGDDASNDFIESHYLAMKLDRMGYAIGLAFCYFLGFLCKSVASWINLRTALRLRTACISSTFTRALKSGIMHSIAPHQLMSFTLEDGEAIVDIIMKASNMIGLFFAFLFAIITAIVLLGAPGMWPLIGIIGLFLCADILSKISKHHYRRSMYFGAKKLTTLEEFITKFRNVVFLQIEHITRKKFIDALSKQYSALRSCNVFALQFSGGLTSAVLIGGLYLMWCDSNIRTDSMPILVLIVIYAHFIQVLMLELCLCLESNAKGQTVLNKVKSAYILSPPEPAKERTSSNLLISYHQCVFKWKHPSEATWLKQSNEMIERSSDNEFSLNIEEFYVPKNQIIGITGASQSGKSSLLYAILGHMNQISGTSKQSCTLGFFPPTPYLIPGSVRDNILMGASYDSAHFGHAVLKTLANKGVCDALGSEEAPIDNDDLTSEQKQRIVMARALYCERDIILFDDPITDFKDAAEGAELFNKICQQLTKDNKTVIVATTNYALLSSCHRIYWLNEGEILREGAYEDLALLPQFEELLDSSKILQSSYKNDIIDGSSLNPSFDEQPQRKDSVLDEEEGGAIKNADVKPKQKKLIRFSIFGIFMFTVIHLINGFFYVIMPLGFIFEVRTEEVRIWPAFLCISVIFYTLFADTYSRIYTQKVASHTTKKLQRRIFERLSSATYNFIVESNSSKLLGYFMDNAFTAHHWMSSNIQQIVIIFCIGSFLILTNFWNAFAVCFLIAVTIAIYFLFKYTILHFALVERHTRQQLFTLSSSFIKGRSVIQSFPDHAELTRSIHQLIERNSSAWFIRKSTGFFAEFILNIFLSIGIIATTLTFLFVPHTSTSISRNTFGVFLIYSLAYFLRQLLSGLFDYLPGKISLKALENAVEEIPLNATDITHDELIEKNIFINLKDVKCRLNGRRIVKIRSLYLGQGSTGIKGNGSQHFASLMHGILKPATGSIYLNIYECSKLSRKMLQKKIGIVPQDPIAYDVTIHDILNPEKNIPQGGVKSALQRFHLWETVAPLANELDESFNKLERHERQLLCLAKCWLMQCPIIIIERPHLYALNYIRDAMNSMFQDVSVVVVGLCDEQMSLCKNVIDFDAKRIKSVIQNNVV